MDMKTGGSHRPPVSCETNSNQILLPALGNGEALFQLAAGGIDVTAARVADGGLDAVHDETALQGLDLLDRRGFEWAVGDVVQLNEVDVAERPLAEVDQGLHLGVCVVHAVDHRVLIARPPSGLLGVGLQGLMEAEEGELLHTGHELVAG